MNIDELYLKTEEAMGKALSSMGDAFNKIRTGRAQINMLDGVKVNYYGTPTALNQVASVTTPDARSFLISPWEAAILKDIQTALVKADLGMTPQNDGKIIRLKVPELTQERRKDLVKSMKKTSEDARIKVRQARKDANEAIKQLEKKKEIGEDDMHKWMDKIQELTDANVKKVDEATQEKEKDLLKV